MSFGKLILVRHGLSVYNDQNRFTGWKDVELIEIDGIRAMKTHITDSKTDKHAVGAVRCRQELGAAFCPVKNVTILKGI